MITSSKEMTLTGISWNLQKRERIRGTDKARERWRDNISTRENMDRGTDRDMGDDVPTEHILYKTGHLIVNINVF